MRKLAFAASLVLVLVVIAACGGAATPMVATTEPASTAEPASEPTTDGGGVDREALANLEYASAFTSSGKAALANGEYREPAAPGSATETVVKLTDHVAFGQLTGGQDVAAVVLVTDPGGSGTFYDLAVVIEQGGQLVNVATTSLGDRVQVKSLGIEDGEIVVDMVTHGPDDPMCCPTQRVLWTFALQGAELVQTSSQVIGSEDTSTEGAPEEPTPSGGQLNLLYDEAVAAGIGLEVAPAEDFMDGDIIPEHLMISFEGYVVPETFHQPRIHLYPIQEFEAGSEIASNVIAETRQFLEERPEAPDTIPFLPPFNAAQAIRAQVSYLRFRNGSGVRFLTHYTQGAVPVNNDELFYTFQGITDDGAIYVSAILPVSHPALPADGSALISDVDFDTAMREAETLLNGEDASSFTPDLALLDAMIRTLFVPSVEASSSVQERTVPDDWVVYRNDDYGYQFSYPPSAVISERGVMGFPSDELPEGMSPDEYMAQLQDTYGDKLCVQVDYGLGYVVFTAPPNSEGKFGPCGRTGAAYELVDKSEDVVIAGQTYTAAGFEEIGPGETLNYRNETLWIRLPDDTLIEYGAASSESATFEEYVKATRDVLLQIVASYTPDQPLAPGWSSVTPDDPYAGWETTVNAEYGLLPASANLDRRG